MNTLRNLFFAMGLMAFVASPLLMAGDEHPGEHPGKEVAPSASGGTDALAPTAGTTAGEETKKVAKTKKSKRMLKKTKKVEGTEGTPEAGTATEPETK